MINCKDCKYWGDFWMHRYEKKRYAKCNVAETYLSIDCECDYGRMAESTSGESEIDFREDFGCIMGEKKEDAII